MAHLPEASALREELEAAPIAARALEEPTSNPALQQPRAETVIQTLRHQMLPPKGAPAHHRAEVAEEVILEDVLLVQEVLLLPVQSTLPIRQCQGRVTETAPPSLIYRK